MTVNELTLGIERLTRTGDAKMVAALRGLLVDVVKEADAAGE